MALYSFLSSMVKSFSKPYSMCCLPDMARLLTHRLTAARITCTGPSQDQASLILPWMGDGI